MRAPKKKSMKYRLQQHELKKAIIKTILNNDVDIENYSSNREVLDCIRHEVTGSTENRISPYTTLTITLKHNE